METTQSKYMRVPKAHVATEIDENEVRITTLGKVKKYVDYSLALFGESGPRRADDGASVSKVFDSIVLKATGRAINHAVTTAEVLKRRVAGLHQLMILDTLQIDDEWQPTEDGLLPVTTTRRVASVSITLTKDASKIDTASAGYQPPVDLAPLSGEYISPKSLGFEEPRPRGSRGSTPSGHRRRGGRASPGGRRDDGRGGHRRHDSGRRY